VLIITIPVMTGQLATLELVIPQGLMRIFEKRPDAKIGDFEALSKSMLQWRDPKKALDQNIKAELITLANAHPKAFRLVHLANTGQLGPKVSRSFNFSKYLSEIVTPR
jgi:hypothetical protein